MRSKKIIRLFTAMLAVVLCTTAFAVPASAGGGDGEPYYTETAEPEVTEERQPDLRRLREYIAGFAEQMAHRLIDSHAFQRHPQHTGKHLSLIHISCKTAKRHKYRQW